MLIGGMAVLFGVAHHWTLTGAFGIGMALAGLAALTITHAVERWARRAGIDVISARRRAVAALDSAGSWLQGIGLPVAMSSLVVFVMSTRSVGGMPTPVTAETLWLHCAWFMFGLGISSAGMLAADARALSLKHPGLFGLPVQRELRELSR